MINQRDSYGRTPLHDACTSGRPESVHYLLKAGADITIVDDNKRSALHACAEYADEQKLWTLLVRHNKVSGHSLEDRFRPSPQTDRGYEPWYSMTHWSDKLEIQNVCGISVIVKTLLSAGSDTMAIDTFHRTPLDLAIEYDCQEMIQALKFTVEPLKNKWNIEPEDQKLETIIARKRSSLSLMDPWEPSVRELLLNPSSYLPYLTLDDIEWISQHNGGNTSGVHKNGSIVPSGQSLLYVATSNGFAEMVNSFGQLACVNDNPKRVLARNPEYSEDAAIEYLAPMLHVACARELPNMVMVETLVEKCRVDINAHALVKSQPWTKLKDAVEGGTALHVLAKATHWWQLEAIKFLLQNGANIDSKNEKGETPLHIACTGTTYADMNCTNNVYGFWRVEAVTILLEHRADIDLLDNDDLSCLHKACSSPQIMRILLDRGANLTDGKLSPLFSAIQMQCLETLTILLDAGLSPNTICPNKSPREHDVFSLYHSVKEETRWALFCACMTNLQNQNSKDSAPMVKLLIERGADLYAPLNDSELLVHYIFEHAEYEIITAFLDCAPSNKVDFNTRDSKGCTVFLAACDWKECLPGYNHKHWVAKETAPFIRALDFGANPLVVDNEGRNALHHLLDNPEMEDEAIIQFLSHDSAKILLHQKDANGFTPLNCALRFLRPAVVEVLLTMGADLLSPDPTNATALHHIAAQCLHIRSPLRKGWWDHKPEFYTGILALWKKFFSLGGSINVRDNKGSPPLFYYLSSSQRRDYKAPENSCCHLEHFATYFSDEIVKDLDFRAKNKDGENSLHVIARRENNKLTKPKHDKDLFQFFVRKGLDPLEEDSRGKSSLDVAAACEQKGILELFQYRN
jgi:ankyrin repeat protein